MKNVTLVVNVENGNNVELFKQCADSYYIHESKFYVFIFDDIDSANIEDIKAVTSWFEDYEYQLKIYDNDSDMQIDDESEYDDIIELGSHLFDLKHGLIIQ